MSTKTIEHGPKTFVMKAGDDKNKPSATEPKRRDTIKAARAPRKPVHERIKKLEAKIDKMNAKHEAKINALTAKLEGMKARHSKLLAIRELASKPLAEIEAEAAEAKAKLKLARKAAKLVSK
jgi:hypothetical protein